MVQEGDIDKENESEDRLRKQLDSKKEILDNKEKEINLLRNSFDEKSGKYIEDIEGSENETEKQANEANRIINSTRTKINSFVRHFTDESQKIKRNIWIIFGVFLGLFFIPYFTLPVLKESSNIILPIDPALFSIIVTLTGLVVLIFKATRSIDSKLFNPNDEDSLRIIQDEATPITQNTIEFTSKKERQSKKLQELNEGIKKVIAISEEYIPGLKEYYSGMALKTEQEHFAFTLRNALRNYGLLDSTIEKKLRRYSNLAQTEKDWLEDASYRISELNGVSKEIIKLAYYDYTGSRTDINNIWALISKEKLPELINILKNNLKLENRSNLPDQPFVEIIRIAIPFSIEKFMWFYNEFYNNLAKEKVTVLRILKELGLSIDPEKGKLIDRFFPITTETKEWTKQLVDNAALVVEQNPVILWLFYLDRVGLVETRDGVWQTEKQVEGFVDKVSDFMIKSLNYPSEFERNDVKNLCSEIIRDKDSFDVSRSTKEFYKRIEATKRLKSLFAYALEAKKVKIPQKVRENTFEKLIAYSDNPVKEMAEKIGSLLSMDQEIVTLFYLDYVQSPKEERKMVFAKIEEGGNIKKLASILLDGTIPGDSQNDKEVKMLSDVLMSLPSFEIDTIRNSYSFYKKIFEDAINLACLLNEQKIKNFGELKFEKIIGILQNITSSRFEALEKIDQQIIDRNQWRLLGQKEFEALTSSTLVIYLHLLPHFDIDKENACKWASKNDLSVKTLYEWVDRKNAEKQFGKQKSTLDEVVKLVFEDTIRKFEHLSDFKRSLEDGKLFESTDELIGARFADLKKAVTPYSDEKSLKLLDRVKEQVAKIMDVQIIPDEFILQTLKSQVISAYMITYKDGPVIRVIKDYLKTACDSLSSQDERFKNLIIMKTTESPAGRGTRVGVVPLRIKDFEEFTKLFHQAFKKAVDDLKKDDTKYQENTFSATLIRIIPSDLTFKPIQIGSEDLESDVLRPITELVRTELSSLDRIQIAASARENETPTVALREVVASLFNQNIKLGSLISEDIKDVIDRTSKLDEVFYDVKFDSELRNRYDAKSNTNLAMKLFEFNKQNPSGLQTQFLGEVRAILNSHGINVSEADFVKISNTLLETLTDIANLFIKKEPM